LIVSLLELEKNKMGAYKNLMIDIASEMYNISKELNNASENADIDEMKTALRSAIANSALTLAFIAELESK
jgi:type VI protein secretion system component VasF